MMTDRLSLGAPGAGAAIVRAPVVLVLGCGRVERCASFGSSFMKGILNRLLVNSEGQDLIEYALLAALIALAAIAAMQSLGGAINSKFDNASSQLAS